MTDPLVGNLLGERVISLGLQVTLPENKKISVGDLLIIIEPLLPYDDQSITIGWANQTHIGEGHDFQCAYWERGR